MTNRLALRGRFDPAKSQVPGSLASLGLGLQDFVGLKALGAVDPKKDVNCIMLFLVGAPSQLDTWDMKPDTPAEIRGPYKPIPTNVSGIQISELFPAWHITRTNMRWFGPCTSAAQRFTKSGTS